MSGARRQAALRTARHAPPLRREVLRDALASSVSMLHHDRADDIPDGYLADYVALAWLRWTGGRLCLTTAGEALCRQLGPSARAA